MILTKLRPWLREGAVRGALVVAAGYVLSRLIYTLGCGVVFDDTNLGVAYQFLDTTELRNNLLRSVFYQHTQPPLFNLYLGLGLRFPDPHVFFAATARATGLALHIGLCELTRRLGARPAVAAFAAIAFAFSPASILFESWLFYSFPVAAMLTIAAWALHRALETERPAAWWIAFGSMAAVVLTRSVFHLVWLLAAVALAVSASRNRRRVLAIAVLPVVLAAGLYVKNRLVFGTFSASTWLGFSLARLTTEHAPLELRRSLTVEGRLSPLATYAGWGSLDYYPPEYRVVPAGLPQIPVLTEPLRVSGRTNHNHAAFVHISETFLADARVMLAEQPAVFLDGVRRAWMTYFQPTHSYYELARNRQHVRGIERFYEVATLSSAWRRSERAPEPSPPEGMCWGWIALAVVVGPTALLAAWRRRTRPEGPTIGFCVLTVAWVAVAGNLLEMGENNRFRFLTEPLAWALCGLAFELVWQEVRRKPRAP